jgi:hypothetical protein
MRWTSSAGRSSISRARRSPRGSRLRRYWGSASASRTARSSTTTRGRSSRTWTSSRSSRPSTERDLKIENYFIGYLKHPYVSIYTGRGCRSHCTFCLWPQTVGGHRYRTRSVENVLEEVKWIRDNMPEVKEIMFDDDTFTDFKPRVEEIARGLGKLGVTWSCNARANVPYSTLKIMKENGLRLLLVGYESGDDQILLNIKKGLKTDIPPGVSARTAASSASRFTGHSSSACPARRARRSKRRSSTRRRSTRTRSRCRSRPRIRGRSCTRRPSRTAGLRRTRPSTL